MKAIYFDRHGGPDVLQYGDLADPVPIGDQVIVRVKAVALNHLDVWVRRGWPGLQVSMPHITGSDVVGELTEDVPHTDWKAGQVVALYPGILTQEDEWSRRGEESVSPSYQILGEQLRGGLAEYVCVPASNIVAPLHDRSFAECAAGILTGLTCWRMLFRQAKLLPGEQVLIVGSGGGVNSLSLQIAHAIGCVVYVLAGSPEKVKTAEDLGADVVLDYNRTPDWHREVNLLTNGRGVDLVIDNVGKETLPKSIRAVRRGGRIVSVGNTSGHDVSLDTRYLFSKQIALIGSTMGSRQDLHDAFSFLRHRNIVPVVDEVAPLSRAKEQIIRIERGDHFGKIVLEP